MFPVYFLGTSSQPAVGVVPPIATFQSVSSSTKAVKPTLPPSNDEPPPLPPRVSLSLSDLGPCNRPELPPRSSDQGPPPLPPRHGTLPRSVSQSPAKPVRSGTRTMTWHESEREPPPLPPLPSGNFSFNADAYQDSLPELPPRTYKKEPRS